MNRKPTFDPQTYDRERGNALILHRDEVMPFYDLPWDYAGPILHALFRWFCGATEAEVKMKDPRDQMLLARIIEHQKANAENNYQFKMRERENKSKAGKASAATRYERQQSATPVDTCQQPSTKDKEKEKEEDKAPEGGRLYSSSFLSPPKGDSAENPHGADGAAAGARPVAHESREAHIQEWPEHAARHYFENDLRERPIQFVLNLDIDEDADKARGFYTKALKELGAEVYAETCWRFVVEYAAKANAYGAVMREFDANYDAQEEAYISKFGGWESALIAAEEKNWHNIRGLKVQREKYAFTGGRILASMLKEAGLARNIDLGAKHSKKGNQR